MLKFQNSTKVLMSSKSFNFRFETDEHFTAVWSDNKVPEESGWTFNEIITIFTDKKESQHDFKLNLIEGVAIVDSVSAYATPDGLTPPPTSRTSSISQGSFNEKTAGINFSSNSKREHFFNPKSELASSRAFVLDSVLLIGLAIAGLLNAQHMALIIIGLMACTAIAATSAYYFSPSMN